MHRTLLHFVTAALFLWPTMVFAHTGVGGTQGFAVGFLHPIGGLDHVLAMVAVGLFAAHLDGRALVLVPASFVLTMAVGGVIGLAGVDLPYVEIGIALSVVVLGGIVATTASIPTLVAMGVVAFFALFHGHAHGAEMPDTTSALAYAAGFMTATALLHTAGITIGLFAGRAAIGIVQAGGAAIALAGLAMLIGVG